MTTGPDEHDTVYFSDEMDLDEPTSTSAGGPDTGNIRVDEAVARLAELESLPTADHADVYEDVHRRLHGALTELDAD